MDNDYTKLVGVVGAFCRTVDHMEDYQRLPWLQTIGAQLEEIDAEMSRLRLELACQFFILPDLDFRFAMFCRLKDFLGDWDGYPLPGDDAADPDDHSGSLADDLTDIYFELDRGLVLYRDDPADPLPAVQLWHTGYVLHWREHLHDARCHLKALLPRFA
ncbi:hypothetical protein MIT9_P2292 [Methylomarinovum caldicuralii]|uniref:DUF5063 domain-containing protein n=1 Tax=Methylomarinovum caldicuralii TaxID=438856 RepID=A0AAU9BVE0_9GAMM|nr:DUF5063 domain-containing protein [Methylomarinovum caldicuralii]BCX82706.1 hypothetical protein MIT9_P2292 [Methylomarinovum caldicuralii]